MTLPLFPQGWVVEWWEPFDANDDRVDPASYRRTKLYLSKDGAEKFAERRRAAQCIDVKIIPWEQP